MYGVHFDDPLSVDNVLQAESGGGRRPATAVGGSAKKQQNLVVKAQLHNQMTKLRGAFLHQDPRIEGTIPSYMVPYTLKAGGLDLDKGQCTDAKFKFMTGEGRFNWLNFCDHIEKARAKQWSEAARLKSAKMFADIDRDGSGRLDPGEIKEALKRLKVNITDQKVMELVRACDSDGDGNISFPEFVDGLSKDLVAPDSVWSERRAAQHRTQNRLPSTKCCICGALGFYSDLSPSLSAPRRLRQLHQEGRPERPDELAAHAAPLIPRVLRERATGVSGGRAVWGMGSVESSRELCWCAQGPRSACSVCVAATKGEIPASFGNSAPPRRPGAQVRESRRPV